MATNTGRLDLSEPSMGAPEDTSFDWRRKLKILGFVLLGGSALGWAFWPEAPATRPIAQIPPREEVVFWHMWTSEWKLVIDRIADRYNESQTRYHVTALSIPDSNATAKFLLAAVGSNPPDCMAQWLPVIPNWADNDLIRPVDELLTPEERRQYREDVYPIIRRMGAYKGRLWGVCTGIGFDGLYVNAKQLRAAGIDPDRPAESLEELDARADRLTKIAPDGELRRIGFLPYGLKVYAEAFGGGIYDWERGRVTIDTPANRRALEYIVARRKRVGFEKVVRFEAGITGGDSAGGWRFLTGSYAITLDGPWRVEQIGKVAPGFDYRTHPLPPPKVGGRAGAGIANGNLMLIPKAARNPQGAMDFIRFWSGLQNPERAAEFYTWGGWLPLTPAIAKAPKYEAWLQKYPHFRPFVALTASPNLRTNPPVAYQQFLLDLVSKAEDAATRGVLTPAQALQRAEVDLARELRRRKELGYRD